ncbi:MAG: hypothetical protein EYC70_15680 [Planctomycetota bacterium]|nr:MAG: hypothetical protein EYC70_15680 [Planctomycetota bacterium]
MKLLFDENLSPRLVRLLADSFPQSQHVEQTGLRGQTDRAIWELARAQGFVIVSKDNDFRQIVFMEGPPPKVIWLSVGNADTQGVAALLKENVATIRLFLSSPEEGLLVLETGIRGTD